MNAAIYTLPVITILLKDPTAAIIGNIIQVIIIQPIFIILLNTLKYKEKSLIKKIVSVITTPLIMPIIGILLNYLQVTLPTPIVDAISQIGSGASGLALFAFGPTLGATKITVQCLKFDLLSVVLIKSLVHPLVAICIAYFMKLENYWFDSLVIAASAPTAFVVYLIPKQFSTEEELVKKIVALSSVVATVSLIFITIMIGQCFMNAENKTRFSLIIWIIALIAMGGIIGSLTKPEISTWYSTLNRSTLTPPNYVFPVAWTILYGIIGTCGWLIWRPQAFTQLSVIKTLYVTQLILNWSWTPLFFHYHLTGLSLVVFGSYGYFGRRTHFSSLSKD